MTGVITSTDASTRRGTIKPGIACDVVRFAPRLSGKKTRKIAHICFQRGGGEAVGVRSITVVEVGSSNHASMPVRFSWRDTATKSRADSNHHRRWAESCLLYTSDAADEEDSVDLGGRRII